MIKQLVIGAAVLGFSVSLAENLIRNKANDNKIQSVGRAVGIIGLGVITVKIIKSL